MSKAIISVVPDTTIDLMFDIQGGSREADCFFKILINVGLNQSDDCQLIVVYFGFKQWKIDDTKSYFSNGKMYLNSYVVCVQRSIRQRFDFNGIGKFPTRNTT